MNRREMLKSVGGFFGGLICAPLIRLDLTHERDLSTLVGQFCATPGEYQRYDLTDPWAYADASVASDGRALIAVPDLRYVATGNSGRRPNVEKVFDAFWPTVEETSYRQWQQMPAVKRYHSAHSYCLRCNHTAPQCKECDGEGDVLGPFGDFLVRCEVCGGLGYIRQPDCPVCHGELDDFPSVELLGDIVIDTYYASLVRQIPGGRWMPGRFVGRDPILIRGDGGIRAMVMPIVQVDEKP